MGATRLLCQGHDMPRLILAGLRFGRLVVSEEHRSDGRRVYWWCHCDCGNHKWIEASKLTSGTTLSCRCLRKEKIAKSLTKHGGARSDHHSVEYNAWINMRDRCENKKCCNYKNYGGRGISVCERWSGENGFLNFICDMGSRPSPLHSLDRVNVNGNYDPINCRWATRVEQSRNKRTVHCVPFRGRMATIPEIAREMGLNGKSLWKRIKRKMLAAIVNEAVEEEIEHQKRGGP